MQITVREVRNLKICQEIDSGFIVITENIIESILNNQQVTSIMYSLYSNFSQTYKKRNMQKPKKEMEAFKIYQQMKIKVMA